MSDIERRGGRRPTRRQREQRAYRLVLATGAFGVIAVAALVLSIAGVLGGGWWVVSAIIAVICFIALRGTLRGGR
jgi:fatty acid desaturase